MRFSSFSHVSLGLIIVGITETSCLVVKSSIFFRDVRMAGKRHSLRRQEAPPSMTSRLSNFLIV